MKTAEILQGISVSSGVGIGDAYLVQLSKTQPKPHVFTSVDLEKQRLKEAIDSFCYHTYGMFQKIRSLLGQEDALILGGQIFMARDLEFVGELHAEIQNQNTAEQAIDLVFSQYLGYFQEMEDELMSQRGADLKDMRDSILDLLQGQQKKHDFPQNVPFILCIHELSPSLMSQISHEKVAGILCEKGGVTSHCAILARASGIPAIFSIENLLNTVQSQEKLVVDASCGRILRNPQDTVLEKYVTKCQHYHSARSELEIFRNLDTRNAQGEKLNLMANIADSGEIHTALELGADGVGLFRTEYLFMDSNHLPSEEQQYRIYTRMAKLVSPRPMAIRTLDIGGDKTAPCIPLEPEENPFLGQRALRLCFHRTDIFATQIRAILRASATCDNISLLVPFVVEVDELEEVAQFVSKCRKDLKEEGVPVSDDVPFGAVIETPSAAILIDLIANYVDYISVGTNDLTQYLTVADRGNLRVAQHYNPFNLSVLRALKDIITCCNQKNIPVTLCGEVVADPRMVPLLLGFGKVNFSVSPSEILCVRRDLSFWTQKEANGITDYVMGLRKSSEVEQYLNDTIRDKQARNKLFQDKIEQIALSPT